ncbi:hypothetical protein, partial [Sansalvadorimonas verongulae]|uniref:hypothetical protein n=1 Tax=Sansalvadorimonas verongulae TaxID=2172824 RepID=UPI001E4C3119
GGLPEGPVAPILITDERSGFCVGTLVVDEMGGLAEKLRASVRVTGQGLAVDAYVREIFWVHPGGARGCLIAVRLTLIHFSRST